MRHRRFCATATESGKNVSWGFAIEIGAVGWDGLEQNPCPGGGSGWIPDLVRQAVEGTTFRMTHRLRTPFVTWTYRWFRPIVVEAVNLRDSAPGVHLAVAGEHGENPRVERNFMVETGLFWEEQ
jgi:hypothetical protein